MKRFLPVAVLVACAACHHAVRPPDRPPERPPEPVREGMASFYGPGFEGRATASGERFDPADLTAAHRTLPFGTRVRVTNLDNGRSVVVRINDRGPYAKGRILDLSLAAARALDMLHRGTARVRLEPP